MIVYKYVVPERIDVIENGCIRFTQAAALNDPFEMHPCFTLFNESLEGLLRMRLRQEEGHFNAHSMVIGEIIIPKKVREHILEFQRIQGRSYPMLSVTKKRNNLLMWSHYANAHRGFVIGFDIDNPFFRHQEPRRMTLLMGVTYSPERFILPRFEEAMTREVYEQTLLRKSVYWTYEEEFRMFADPNDADIVKKGNDGLDIYLFKFPPECLKEIIFGHQMQASLKQRTSDIVSGRYLNVELFEAHLSETNFDLDIVPYDSRTCVLDER